MLNLLCFWFVEQTLYKRLDNVRGRYRWPRDSSEARNLTWQEFDWLMSGLDIEQPKAIRANFG